MTDIAYHSNHYGHVAIYRTWLGYFVVDFFLRGRFDMISSQPEVRQRFLSHKRAANEYARIANVMAAKP